MLAAAERFIREVRDVYARIDSTEERLAEIAPLLRVLLKDQELRKASESWPFRNDPSRGYIENLLFYEDSDYGFVLNSLMKKPGESTPVHDHGHTWTMYGVLRGTEKVIRFERADDGSSDERAELKQVDASDVGPGYIDLVRPYEIHVEYTGVEPVVGVIFRSGRVGNFLQNYYDLGSGMINKTKGPVQIPHLLSL